MIYAIIFQSIVILGLGGIIYKLYLDFSKAQKELLDRLMSKSFTEYSVGQNVINRAPRRRSMTDSMEAEIEARKKLALRETINA